MVEIRAREKGRQMGIDWEGSRYIMMERMRSASGRDRRARQASRAGRFRRGVW